MKQETHYDICDKCGLRYSDIKCPSCDRKPTKLTKKMEDELKSYMKKFNDKYLGDKK